MFTEYHISSNELDSRFIESVKSLYPNKNLSIIIEEELDETEYLLKHPANKAFLISSIKQAEDGNVIKINLSDL